MGCEKYMTKRCDHCIYFRPSVFDGETQSGYACWNGYCLAQMSDKRGELGMLKVKNMHYACDSYFTPIPKLKNWSWKWSIWWTFVDILEYLKLDLTFVNVAIDYSSRFRFYW